MYDTAAYRLDGLLLDALLLDVLLLDVLLLAWLDRRAVMLRRAVAKIGTGPPYRRALKPHPGIAEIGNCERW
jgi:hypothetical protein